MMDHRKGHVGKCFLLGLLAVPSWQPPRVLFEHREACFAAGEGEDLLVDGKFKLGGEGGQSVAGCGGGGS
jgi:hypothetical protein